MLLAIARRRHVVVPLAARAHVVHLPAAIDGAVPQRCEQRAAEIAARAVGRRHGGGGPTFFHVGDGSFVGGFDGVCGEVPLGPGMCCAAGFRGAFFCRDEAAGSSRASVAREEGLAPRTDLRVAASTIVACGARPTRADFSRFQPISADGSVCGEAGFR